MKKTILALALAAGLTSFAGSAKAGLVNYYFSTTGINNGGFYGGAPDPSLTDYNFSGIIRGLQDSGYSSPASVEITSFGGKSLVSPIIFSTPESLNGSFNVENGTVSLPIYGSLTGISNDGQFYLHNYPWAFSAEVILPNGELIDSYNPLNYTLAAVPEPSQVAASLLLAAGIAGFVIVKRRKEASELEALAA
jgi:hypothetical protein